MSETGKLGGQAYAEHLQSQQRNIIDENTPEDANENRFLNSDNQEDLSTYKMKLEGDTSSAAHHRKNDLSKQFDDITISAVVVNAPTGEETPATSKKQAEAEDFAPPAVVSSSSSHREEKRVPVDTHEYPLSSKSRKSSPPKEIASVMISEPKHRFANPDHASFHPPADPSADTSSSGVHNMYYSTSPFELHYPGYHGALTADHSFYQYNYPSQTNHYYSNEIVVPTPAHLMPPPPPVLTPSSTDSRKHRREISDHVNPMAHRRTNTCGDSEPTKGYERENEADVMAPIQENQYQVSPTDGATSPHVAPSFPHGPIDHSYYFPGYIHPPFGTFDPPPPPLYNISSSQSDSGASYNTGSATPVLAYAQTQSLRSSPRNDYHEATHSYPVQHSMSHRYSYHEGRAYHEYEASSGRVKSADCDEADASSAHHRKQSSLGSFLATTGIFEEVFQEMEKEGYSSAPENIEENTIQASTEPISFSNFSRSMSEDNFFQQFYRAINDDEDAPVSTAPRQQNYTGGDVASSLACLPVGSHYEGDPLSANPRPQLILKQTSGGDANRHRRKCAVAECPNRVVQGGLCISHGAKRKTCNFPGCTKNVKKQGKCSAHGPERKRCEAEGCTKVAVQGGKCISHGAKKKGCAVEGCSKQSIMGGMCKKHYDEYNGVVKVRAPRKKKSMGPNDTSRDDDTSRDGHVRGLSVFNEMETMERIIHNASPINFESQAK
ncbi:hypothetical protein HJC23_003056 [Cyclotella cryptica]|uniref:WRKY19-like zinc finger domain-containing protein n=1 Tax=Cyclotella cryptica TaxID=29204 RepID=A0ABD3PYC1_9STRA